MTRRKPPKKSLVRPPLKCSLCHEADRTPGGFWCPPCADHQARAAAVARRVATNIDQSRSAAEIRGAAVSRDDG